MTGPTFFWRPAVAAATTGSDLGATFAAQPNNSDTLTGATAAFTLDGYTALLNDRILVKDQTTKTQNGVYGLTTVGSAASGIGPIATFSGLVGGTGYISGTYTNAILTGGTGEVGLATITVAGPGVIYQFNNEVGGSGYTPGVYGPVTLTGGTGAGATANIYVYPTAYTEDGPATGACQLVNFISYGTGYTPGDILSVAAATVGGTGSGFSITVEEVLAPVSSITTGGVTQTGNVTQPTGGTITSGTYTAVSLTGGTGTGAQATVNVSGDNVTGIFITTEGANYKPNDVLSYTGVGIGTGGTVQVLATQAGSGYTVGDTLSSALGGRGSGFTANVATVVPSNWVLTRTADANKNNNFVGLAEFVDNGTTNVHTAWVQTAQNVVLNTTLLTFEEFVP